MKTKKNNKTIIQKAKIIRIAVLICIACMLIGVTGCRNVTEVINRQEVVNHEVVITQADKSGLPEFVADLVKLDEIFRAYSYEGYDEDIFGEMLLKYYIAATGDVYAEYMNAEEYEEYNSDSAGEFVGVGISIIDTVLEIIFFDLLRKIFYKISDYHEIHSIN